MISTTLNEEDQRKKTESAQAFIAKYPDFVERARNIATSTIAGEDAFLLDLARTREQMSINRNILSVHEKMEEIPAIPIAITRMILVEMGEGMVLAVEAASKGDDSDFDDYYAQESYFFAFLSFGFTGIIGASQRREDSDAEMSELLLKWVLLLNELSKGVGTGSFEMARSVASNVKSKRGNIGFETNIEAIESFYELFHRPETQGISLDVLVSMAQIPESSR